MHATDHQDLDAASVGRDRDAELLVVGDLKRIEAGRPDLDTPDMF